MKNYKGILVVIIVIIVYAMFYRLYFKNRVFEIIASVNYFNMKQETLYEKELNLKNIVKNKEILENIADDNIIKIANSTQFPSQILEIEEILHKNNLIKVEKRMLSKEAIMVEDTTVIMPRVSVVGSGEYENIMRFLRDIQTSVYMYNLENITITNSSIQGKLEFEAVLTMYYFEMVNNYSLTKVQDTYEYTNPFESGITYE
jgi:Tfp pilus assembly protein PilO